MKTTIVNGIRNQPLKMIVSFRKPKTKENSRYEQKSEKQEE
jgi:uncharacterized DUF497 family protein